MPPSDSRIRPELDDVRGVECHNADAEIDIMKQRYDPESTLVTSIALVLLVYGLIGVVLQLFDPAATWVVLLAYSVFGAALVLIALGVLLFFPEKNLPTSPPTSKSPG